MIIRGHTAKRRRHGHQAIMLAIVTFLLTGFGFEWTNRASHAASSTTPDDAPIRALLTQMTEAWNRGDPAGVAAAFAVDGHLVTGDGTHVVTRAEIERYFAQLRERLPKGTKFTATVTSVQFQGSNTAVLLSEGGFLWPGDTTVVPERQGIQSIIAVRKGSSWHAVLLQRTRRLIAAGSTPK